jgi:hypothetical protein
MTGVVRPLGNTVTLDSSNNAISGAKVVRILNGTGGLALITLSDPVTNTVVGSVQLLAGTDACIEKRSNYLLKSDQASGVSATKVGYGN